MRLTLFIALLLVGMFFPFWVYCIALTLYLVRYNGIEALLIALCIDAQFGTSGLWDGYRYLVTTGVLVLLATLIKPYIQLSRS